MKKLLYLILPIIVILTLHEYNDVVYQWPYSIEPVKPVEAIVVKNVDGDTIKVRINGEEETIRMIGVDTPETVHPSKPVEFYGKEASDFTKSLCPTGTKVYLTFDWDPRDKYDRMLAYVWYQRDDQWILHNLNLIVNGYGHAYTVFSFDKEYMSLFMQAEQHARQKAYGLWRDYDSLYEQSQSPLTDEMKKEEPKEVKTTLVMSESKGDLEIVYVQYEGASEYVEITNRGKTKQTLDGYKLVSTKGEEEYLFLDLTLSPAESIRIYSGPEATEPVWSTAYVHANSGDGVVLLDDQSNTISFYYW
ncbi:MAG TPA: thermonuclease family protein [Thermotogota bacterium]|nr:thermonuclease family protein [Thermotogota bacterium]